MSEANELLDDFKAAGRLLRAAGYDVLAVVSREVSGQRVYQTLFDVSGSEPEGDHVVLDSLRELTSAWSEARHAGPPVDLKRGVLA